MIAESKGFSNATKDNPVDAVEFLHWLDLSCLEDLLNGLYGREPVYPPVAMLKAILLMDLKRMKFFTELARALKSEMAEMLGFEKDGIVLIPGYKNLWHFCNIRLKDRWDEIFAILRKNVVSKAAGLSIGKDTVQDATPIRSCNHDDEAEYNAHYKVKEYKADILTDLKTGISLSKRVTGINNDEGRNLIPQLEELTRAGIDVKRVDGGYDDYRNLAWMGVHGIKAHHPIHENWVHNRKGEISNLKRLYNKHWEDSYYRSNADLKSILPFLFEKGYYEEVGSFFRNLSMEEYEN